MESEEKLITEEDLKPSVIIAANDLSTFNSYETALEKAGFHCVLYSSIDEVMDEIVDRLGSVVFLSSNLKGADIKDSVHTLTETLHVDCIVFAEKTDTQTATLLSSAGFPKTIQRPFSEKNFVMAVLTISKERRQLKDKQERKLRHQQRMEANKVNNDSPVKEATSAEVLHFSGPEDEASSLEVMEGEDQRNSAEVFHGERESVQMTHFHSKNDQEVLEHIHSAVEGMTPAHLHSEEENSDSQHLHYSEQDPESSEHLHREIEKEAVNHVHFEESKDSTTEHLHYEEEKDTSEHLHHETEKETVNHVHFEDSRDSTAKQLHYEEEQEVSEHLHHETEKVALHIVRGEEHLKADNESDDEEISLEESLASEEELSQQVVEEGENSLEKEHPLPHQWMDEPLPSERVVDRRGVALSKKDMFWMLFATCLGLGVCFFILSQVFLSHILK